VICGLRLDSKPIQLRGSTGRCERYGEYGAHSYSDAQEYSRLHGNVESCYNSFSMAAPRTPKYRQIYERLSRNILAGHYQPGQKLPSEAALVRRFGASRITVGRALRELQQRQLIDRIAGSGTYVRRAAGARREGLLFGLVIPNLGETEIFEPICQAIAASRAANNHALLWPHANFAANKERECVQLCEQCIRRKVAGVFFAPLELSAQSAAVNRRVMKLLKEAGIPVVLLDRRPDDSAAGERCDFVGIDNYRAGYVATEHLLHLGASKLGFVAYEHQASTVKERFRGYKDAIAVHAEDRCKAQVIHLAPASRVNVPSAALRCDAFVCANDRIAAGVMHQLLARGVRIPRDVRMVGIDDVNYAALLPVPLTTIHQPCREIGEAALQLMLERLDRPKMPARDVLLECALVIRQSCGADRPRAEAKARPEPAGRALQA